MSTFFKKDLPTLIIAVLGFSVLAEWFLPIQQLTDLKSFLSLTTTLITYGSFGIGTVYALTAEYTAVKRNRNIQQYLISGSFFAIIIIMTAICVMYGGLRAFYNPEYRWYQYNLYSPQSQAMYAVMFLFQCGSLYRVLRLRNMESTVLIIAGVTFILSQIPLFASFVPGVDFLGGWMADAPSLGGTRPANITAAIGAIVVAIRALIGREQTTMETVGGG
ncbi:hypothetical protein JW865_06275 [Candidatus Bathyarchaeota archaeon]|nr:hypothetical protein [Candidatus Bathyarchaeota archaeon]